MAMTAAASKLIVDLFMLSPPGAGLRPGTAGKLAVQDYSMMKSGWES
jgi:hypothetical protein